MHKGRPDCSRDMMAGLAGKKDYSLEDSRALAVTDAAVDVAAAVADWHNRIRAAAAVGSHRA